MLQNGMNASRLIPLIIFTMLSFLVSPLAAQERLVTPAWTSVSVGVADLDQALELWVDVFGFSVLNEFDGEDAELATLWHIRPSDIKRQALIGLPEARYGQLHLVEFTEPGPAVREGARPFDPSPHSLVIHAEDLQERVKEIKAAGYTFVNAEPVELIAADGSSYSEIHLGVHDEVNVVLREVAEPEASFNPRGFSGIVALLNIVEFARTERDFYSKVIGLDLLAELQLEGPIAEQLMGRPSGNALDISRWGEARSSSDARSQVGMALGQIELLDFRGVRGTDLYSVAIPTQLGILHVSYTVQNLDHFRQRLRAVGIPLNERDYRQVIFGNGRFIRFRSPAGMNAGAFEE